MYGSTFSRLCMGFAVFNLLGMVGCTLPSPVSQQSVATQVAAGNVRGGSQPISYSTIQLYAVGISGLGSQPTPLLLRAVHSDGQGNFTLTGLYSCPSATVPVYITATGGNPGLADGTNNSWIRLIAALGECGNLGPNSFININEVTTVGTLWALQEFIAQDGSIAGPAGSIDLQNAFVTAGILVNTRTGTAQSAPPVGNDNRGTINAMANILATCVNSDGNSEPGSPCGRLSTLVTPVAAVSQRQLVSIALEIAQNPSFHVAALYDLGPGLAAFQPVISSVPTDWSLGLAYPSPQSFAINLNVPTGFMGDSIFARWTLPLKNKAVSGQRSSAMLSRMQFDILGQGFSRMVLLAGTNDIRSPDATSSAAVQNIKDMAEMASEVGIQPVLCLLPPLNPPDGVDYSSQIAKMNAAITSLAATKGYLLVDFNSPMLAHPEYFVDGIHPSPAGYAVMEAALAAVVRK
jgi:hypothetical protein